ncbi:MAG: hypothetical protein U9R27_10645 [Campylobacterota bacterium]|nr:hypothetical protein [Campylobacterota bacterium]
MKRFKSLFLATVLLLVFSGCEQRSPTEMRRVHWDRDMCERCKMVVSDRHHAVQVINIATGRSYMYDDIGCVLLWFDDEKIDWAGDAKIWITDVATGEWIDARTALYDTHNITPMAYGFAAHENNSTIKAGEEIIDFTEVTKRIFEIEANKNRKAY